MDRFSKLENNIVKFKQFLDGSLLNEKFITEHKLHVLTVSKLSYL